MSLTSALAVSDSYNSDSDSKYSPGKNKNSNQNFIEDDDNIGRRRAGPRPIGKTNLTDFADPKPLNGRIGYGAMSALPSISAGSGALNEKKKQAADEIKKGQLQLSEQRKQEDELRKHLGNINSEEVEKRAQHMAEQRDKLILMKKLERDRKVREEEERQLKLNADNYGNGNNGNGEITESQLRAKVQAQVLALNQNKSEAKGSDRGDRGGERGSDRGSDGIDLDDKRRSAMRVALARRMKLDLIESEEIKLAQMQEDQFADLDRKLQQVRLQTVSDNSFL